MMKIVVTGSLGHISHPLTKELVKKGHTVTVISSKAEKRVDIEALGATAAIGSLEDADFLKSAFSGADAVYTMIPPPNFFDPNLDMAAFYFKILNNYVEAIKNAGVKRVVHLSSIGAHMEKDSGIILDAHKGEAIMRGIPNISLTIMRPTAFFYNLLAFIPVIKNSGMMVSNYGGEDMISWVSPLDIAAAVAEELVTINGTNKVRYVASEEMKCNELAQLLGSAIGKPDLKWVVAGDKQMLDTYVSFGMPEKIVAGLIEMNARMHDGRLFEDYNRNKPVMGKVKLSDFATDFATAYNQ